MPTIDWLPMPPRNIRKEGEEGPSEEQLYYPRITHSQRITDDELFELAEKHNPKWRDYILRAAISVVCDTIAEQLRQGNTVSLRDLGIFRPQITTDTEITSDKRTHTRHVVLSGINFTPSKHLLKEIGTPKFEWRPDAVTRPKPTDEEVLEKMRYWFQSHDAITRQQFSEATGLKRTAATNLIKQLIAQGHFLKSGAGKDTCYTLNT